jgi:hypothetical protein
MEYENKGTARKQKIRLVYILSRVRSEDGGGGMKGIDACNECAYYDIKRDFCTKGAIDGGYSSNMFFEDCPLPDVEPVKNGACLECGMDWSKPNYCPRCGARWRK